RDIAISAHHTTTRKQEMTASTLRSCISAGLFALALAPVHATLAQSTDNDAAMEAVGKCATSSGRAAAACGVAGKGVLDFLAQTSEEQAWAAGMSCNNGSKGDTTHDKFVEIRRQAKEWGK